MKAFLIAASALALLVIVPLESTPASNGTELLPDLVSTPPTNQLLKIDSSPYAAGRLLLRFDGHIYNGGAGAAEIRGAVPNGDTMTSVSQRIYRDDGSSFEELSGSAQLQYESSDGHNHWHLKNAAGYSLWDTTGSAEVAPSMKVGFCLGDVDRVDSWARATPLYTLNSNHFCEQGQPTAASVSEGISAGWRDTYPRSLPFQWVDVSEVQPGEYRLGAAVDPDDLLRESEESNNAASLSTSISTVPGYMAEPVALGAVPKDRARKIRLSAAKFGAAGPATFKIESAPQHGTLDRQVGETFGTDRVNYTPDLGYEGSDSFSYSVRDGGSSFPINPAGAAVSLSLGPLTPIVTISGAPSSLLAGTAVQLSAAVTGDTPDVTWSVPGGAGTISETGLYVAPAQPPVGGTATIRAESDSGAYAEVPISIVAPVPPQPAPTSAKPKLAGRSLLARPTIARSGDFFVIGVKAARAGVIRISLLKRGRALGFCKTRAPARRVVSCRIRLRPGSRVRGGRIVVSLRSKGKLLAKRVRKL